MEFGITRLMHIPTPNLASTQSWHLEQAHRISWKLGFSLIEILVALIIFSLLAAAVYPVAIQQVDKWQALRVARDLSHLRIALEHFQNDTQTLPRYFTQTATRIDRDDPSMAAAPFTQREVDGWNGPYIDSALAESLLMADAFETGYDYLIRNDVYCVVPDIAAPAPCGRGRWSGVIMVGVRVGDFLAINDLVDPQEKELTTTAKSQDGRLLFASYSAIAGDSDPGDMVYLAVPYLADNH